MASTKLQCMHACIHPPFQTCLAKARAWIQSQGPAHRATFLSIQNAIDRHQGIVYSICHSISHSNSHCPSASAVHNCWQLQAQLLQRQVVYSCTLIFKASALFQICCHRTHAQLIGDHDCITLCASWHDGLPPLTARACVVLTAVTRC